MGDTCIDTVAFGNMVNTTSTAHSTMIQSIAWNVATANNGLPPSPTTQSVINLTFAGGNYVSLVYSPVTNATATFANTIATAVQTQLAALGYSGVTVQVVGVNAGSIIASFLLTYPAGLSASSGTAAL
jgi:hypothetical protein